MIGAASPAIKWSEIALPVLLFLTQIYVIIGLSKSRSLNTIPIPYDIHRNGLKFLFYNFVKQREREKKVLILNLRSSYS